MRYRLRTLLILLAVAPPMLAGVWFPPTVAVVALAFLVFVAWFAAVSVGVAVGLIAIADAVITPWENRK